MTASASSTGPWAIGGRSPARRWLEGNKPILLLLGTTGTGKSLAAHVAGVEWARTQAEHLARYHRCDAHHPLKARLRHYAGDVSRWCGKKGAAVVDARVLPETLHELPALDTCWTRTQPQRSSQTRF